MIIRLDDDRDDGLMHDPTCNCTDCARRDAAEEAEELAALGDEPPPWWVRDPPDEDSLDSNPCPPVPECDWCGGKGCDTCSDPNYAGVEP